jgi:hypothetical protein
MDSNTQTAPYPHELADMVLNLTGKPGWRFVLEHIDRGQGSQGLTLDIIITTPNAYSSEQMRTVHHYMPVPPAAYDKRSWRRWLFEQCSLVDLHEQCEWFEIDGVKPFAPHHAPGNNPYLLFEHGTDEDVRTDFRGNLKEI